ncbi:barstar family protein [Micromonospora tulbaghiae]|uniref:Barstar family protein n=1 Tax=Micromonospora tulbaghiae TaxID=479978 RepID=A0AAW4JPY7_9ACTN|nr:MULTISPECIES: barstar family protein [Micromonospora]KAB1906447.1 barstar family protein [Micromonospora sp. AMSO1212t]MBO4141868.1 barstar family protein [Micromonospora tulbaghiae]
MGAASPQAPAWLVYDGAPPEPDGGATVPGSDGGPQPGGGALPGGVLIHGTQARTRAGLHEALAGVLALPGWYGRNWDALADALADRLDAGPLTVVVTDAADLLADEPPAQLGTLLDVLGAVAAGGHETLRVVLRDHPDRLAALRDRVAAVLSGRVDGRVGGPPSAG